MMTIKLKTVALAITLAGMSGLSAFAAEKASDADKDFVAKVSQGGMYEVELGKVAEKQGATQDIKDQGNTEAHDHKLVGEKLKVAAKEAGIEFSTELNGDFKKRLANISEKSGDDFDKAYIDDMEKIHDADGAAFLKESESGSATALKSFAAETYNIVQRHIGELKAKTLQFKR